ncbi:MAG: diacylglycerol kinase family protein [Ureaplasma sp.]|nr:diacylglycerol kinase family protein [Ureaplasma sp.]MDE7221652.1 diacylglycerol kinase family protein [Ureaplasma sp.]
MFNSLVEFLKRTFRKFSYAFRGFILSLKEEKSLVVHTIFGIIALVISAILQLSPIKWAIIIFLIGLVISSELMNTAIENVVDMVSFKFNFNAKKIKDVSAAATLILAITAIIIGLLIFIPQIVLFAQNGYGYNGWK